MFVIRFASAVVAVMLPWFVDRHQALRAESGCGAMGPDAQRARDEVVLEFPAERAMGVLYFRDAAPGESQRGDWQRIGLARGTVPVPAGKTVRLDLSAAACKDLTPLTMLPPDALEMLYVRAADLDARALASIGHLHGLRYLEFSDCVLRDSDAAHLAKLASLRELQFKHTPVGDDTIAGLVPLRELEKVMLSRTRVTEHGLIHLAKLPSLKRVSLSYTDIGDQGLEHLRAVATLEELQLSAMQYVTNEGLAHISRLPRLRLLDISETSVSDDGLAHLSSLLELHVLRLGRTKVGDAGLEHLKPLRSLEELDLPDAISDDGLAHVANLTSLRRLTVRPSQVTDAGLVHLSRLERLEFLNLAARRSMRGRVSDAGAAHLAGLQSLRTLWLQFTDITDQGLATLAQLKSLESLLLNGNQITSDGLRHLTGLPSLTYLNIAGLKGATASLRHLAGLRHLRHLKVGAADQLGLDGVGVGESDQGIGYLAGLSQLAALELDRVAVSNRGLEQLAGLRNLQRLDLGNNDNTISDDGLLHLAGMQRLEHLRVRGAITDRGLEHLAKLSSLRFVAIQSRTVSDQAIESLKQRVASLQEVTKIRQPLLRDPPQLGAAAPGFEVRTFDGRSIRLDDQRGKVVLLYFWATWCTPCVAQTPELRMLHEELSRKHDRFAMVSLSLDEDDHLARRHVERFQLRWPQAWIGLDSPIRADYAVDSAPCYVVVDPDGKIARISHDGKEIAKRVAELLR